MNWLEISNGPLGAEHMQVLRTTDHRGGRGRGDGMQRPEGRWKKLTGDIPDYLSKVEFLKKEGVPSRGTYIRASVIVDQANGGRGMHYSRRDARDS